MEIAADFGQLGPRERRLAVLASTIGNGLEFYDFITFSFFAIQIGNTFFPSQNHYLSLMGALATFGAGYIGRPIGAWVLGGYADREGRKPVLLISMVLMGSAIGVLALTPPYADIGIAAPFIAVAARLVQGFALGAEVGVSTACMIEGGGHLRRGFNASLQSVSQYVATTLGALVGLVLSLLLDATQLATIGWRIALLLGTSVVPFALVIRRSLPETRQEPEPEPVADFPGPTLRQVVWCGATLMATGTIATNFFNYTATLGQSILHLSTSAALLAQLSTNAAGIAASLAGGWLCDRFGRRLVLLWPRIALATLFVPAMQVVLHAPGIGTLILVNVILSSLSVVTYGALYAAISESLPPSQRARTFALIFAVPVTLFGGTTQMLITWLIHVTGTPMAAAWYLAVVQTVGIIAVLYLPESSPRHRKQRQSLNIFKSDRSTI